VVPVAGGSSDAVLEADRLRDKRFIKPAGFFLFLNKTIKRESLIEIGLPATARPAKMA
jgi:hypothetical protein